MTDQVANEKGQDALLSQAGKEPQGREAMVSPQTVGRPVRLRPTPRLGCLLSSLGTF